MAGQSGSVLSMRWFIPYRVANMARREEKVAASSFRVLSSFLSFIMVSVTMAFSFSYLLFRLAKATSAVCGRRDGSEQLEDLVVLPATGSPLICTIGPVFFYGFQVIKAAQ